MGETLIGRRSKIDHLVHVAHNVTIRRTALLIAGSLIGAGAVVGLGAVALKDVPAVGEVAGNPARPLALRRSLRSNPYDRAVNALCTT